MSEEVRDVVIIGGGPAGAVAAMLLARKGWKVTLCERDRFPRFKIGESLLPHSMEIFHRLGIAEELQRHAFPKPGGEIATACGRRLRRFYFEGALQLDHREAYQVERAWFDGMLLDRARQAGVEVWQPCRVETLETDEEGVTLQTERGALRGRYVLDCSGRNAVIGQRYDLRRRYDDLQKFSVYAHYYGVQRDAGRDAGLTRLIRAEKHWFWMIPIDLERTSVGLVMDIADFRSAGKSPAVALEEAIAASALMRERMAGATRIIEVQSTGDYSYRNTRFHGPRWLLAGDAAGFIDPIFSTGVFLAVHSAEHAAAALNTALQRPWLAPLRFAWYARGLRRLMDQYLRFVRAWYAPEFVDVFTTPRPPYRIPQAVNSVLGGNIRPNFSVWWRLQLFYLVMRIQRRRSIVPKLADELAREDRERADANALHVGS